MESTPPPALAWVDLETTGLDEGTCAVLEVGIILTDWSLTPLAEQSWLLHFAGPVSDFIAGMHGPQGSNLLALCRQCPNDAAEVEAQVRAWLATHGCPLDAPKPLLAGRNAHFDRRFLRRHLPRLEACLSHRNLDVSSLRLAMGEWAGVVVAKDAAEAHRSLPDLHADLAVARRFRAQMMAERELAESLPRCRSCQVAATRWFASEEGRVLWSCDDHGGWGFDSAPWSTDARAVLLGQTPRPAQAG